MFVGEWNLAFDLNIPKRKDRRSKGNATVVPQDASFSLNEYPLAVITGGG